MELLEPKRKILNCRNGNTQRNKNLKRITPNKYNSVQLSASIDALLIFSSDKHDLHRKIKIVNDFNMSKE
jgi:hypothetical protein